MDVWNVSIFLYSCECIYFLFLFALPEISCSRENIRKMWVCEFYLNDFLIYRITIEKAVIWKKSLNSHSHSDNIDIPLIQTQTYVRKYIYK